MNQSIEQWKERAIENAYRRYKSRMNETMNQWKKGNLSNIGAIQEEEAHLEALIDECNSIKRHYKIKQHKQ